MIKYKKISLYTLFVLSLFIGFILQENSSGGAKIDHDFFQIYINFFYLDFYDGLEKFLENPSTIIQLPVFYIIISFFLKIIDNLVVLKFGYILICSFLPLIFFLILKKKFQFEKEFLFYFSLLIFLSPYFRTSSIWLLGDNLSLIFLSLSILFYLKFQDKKKILDIYLCFIFLILCSYIRHYYSFFIIYYLFYVYKNLNTKHLLYLIILSFILSLPALFYLKYIILNYNFIDTISSFSNTNYLSSGFVILTIILFYLIPFIINREFVIFNYYKKKIKILFLITLITFLIYIIDIFFFKSLIVFPANGGGVFVKLIYQANPILRETLLFIVFLISFLVIDFIFHKNRFSNYLLLIILLISLPFEIIYQKYLDPLFYLLFFGLINSNYIKDIFFRKVISLNFVFIYFSFFYLFSFFYYLNLT